MSRRKKNKRDKYGIYEIPNYQEKKKPKKKKELDPLNIVRGLIGIALLVVVGYVVVFGMKISMRGKALALYNQEDYDGASDLFREALSPSLPLLTGIDNDIRYYLADCYVNMGKYGQACAKYNQIQVWHYPNKVEEITELKRLAYGLQLYAWGEYEEALPILLAAYDNGYSDLVLYVGSCYGQLGDLENMQLYYDKFLRHNDMNSFMYAQYAAIALDQNSMESALNYIELGKSLKDQSSIKELLYDEIVYYEKMCDYNTAFEKAKAFVAAYPDDVSGKAEYDLLYTRRSEEE